VASWGATTAFQLVSRTHPKKPQEPQGFLPDVGAPRPPASQRRLAHPDPLPSHQRRRPMSSRGSPPPWNPAPRFLRPRFRVYGIEPAPCQLTLTSRRGSTSFTPTPLAATKGAMGRQRQVPSPLPCRGATVRLTPFGSEPSADASESRHHHERCRPRRLIGSPFQGRRAAGFSD
jgi:hypothetical protein